MELNASERLSVLSLTHVRWGSCRPINKKTLSWGEREGERGGNWLAKQTPSWGERYEGRETVENDKNYRLGGDWHASSEKKSLVSERDLGKK